MSFRNAWALVLLANLTGCEDTGGDLDAACLEEHPGDIRCCFEGGQVHVDNGTCCPDGMHAISDVEHPDWRICKFNEDAGADAH